MRKRVLVTGGASGIGAAIVRLVASSGYGTDFTYFSSASRAKELCDELGGQDVRAFQLDLGKRDDVIELSKVLTCGDAVYHGLVHNAGMTSDQLSNVPNLEEASRVFDVNFWSFVHLVSAFLPAMRKWRGGRVVAVTSIAAGRGARGNGFYSASKAAIEAYCRCLVEESARKGITINCVAPGYVDTNMIRAYPGVKNAAADNVPVGRCGEPHEIASLVGHLLSPEAAYTAGSTFVIDGGLSATLRMRGGGKT